MEPHLSQVKSLGYYRQNSLLWYSDKVTERLNRVLRSLCLILRFHRRSIQQQQVNLLYLLYSRLLTFSKGALIPNVECKVVSPEGKNLPWGERGELWSRSPSNASGYLGNPQASAETWDEEGFFHTGDEAFIHETGWVYITDRIKELIKVSGNQVSASLEFTFLFDTDFLLPGSTSRARGSSFSSSISSRVGLFHSSVDFLTNLTFNSFSSAAVIGIPHDFTGEVAKAFVALSPIALASIKVDSSAEERIINSIKKHVSDHKVRLTSLSSRL